MNLVVTGGSRGIGAAIVQAAIARGDNVAFTYRNQAEAAQAVLAQVRAAGSGARCEAYAMDTGDSAQVEQAGERMVEDFGHIDAVVVNAGINRNGLAVSMSDEDWAEVLHTNLTGAFYVARFFLGHFLPQRRGRLVFMSSIGSAGVSGQVAYCASKAGLLGLSAGLAKEYGPRGITSNCIVAGFFETDMTRSGMSDGNRRFWLDYCPARRLGRLDEVAQAALFLTSDAASFVNGQDLAVTGGMDWAP
jgi:3-oxoacyl-[acyl-carrier protein] reductase